MLAHEFLAELNYTAICWETRQIYLNEPLLFLYQRIWAALWISALSNVQLKFSLQDRKTSPGTEGEFSPSLFPILPFPNSEDALCICLHGIWPWDFTVQCLSYKMAFNISSLSEDIKSSLFPKYGLNFWGGSPPPQGGSTNSRHKKNICNCGSSHYLWSLFWPTVLSFALL